VREIDDVTGVFECKVVDVEMMMRECEGDRRCDVCVCAFGDWRR